jgi:hypothetical protein
LKEAIHRLLGVWTFGAEHSTKVLRELIELAKRQPSLELIHDFRRLFFHSQLMFEADYVDLGLEILEAVGFLAHFAEAKELLEDLRSRPEAWRSEFAPTWVEVMAKADPRCWLSALVAVSPDLEQEYRDNKRLQPFLHHLVEVCAGSLDMVKRALTEADGRSDWLTQALLGPDGPFLVASVPDPISPKNLNLVMRYQSQEEIIPPDLVEAIARCRRRSETPDIHAMIANSILPFIAAASSEMRRPDW